MKHAWLLGFSLAFAFVGACRPTLDDDLSHVDGPRILAVQSEPAEAKPGEEITLRALTTDGVMYPLVTSLDWSFCVARRSLAEPTSLSAACLHDAPGALVALGAGAEARGAIPAEACRLFGPDRPLAEVAGEPAGRPADPDVTGGYFLPGVVRAPGAGDALFDVRVRCGLAGATQEDVATFERTYRSNTNPRVADVTVTHADGRLEAAAEGAEITASAGEVLGVRVAWPACIGDAPCGGAERYPAFDAVSRTLGSRREAMRVSWLASRGRFAETRTGRDEADELRDVATTWTAPSAADPAAPAILWTVLRDARGGTGFRSLRVRVR